MAKLPQVFVCEKSVPVNVTPCTCRTALPQFVIVIVWLGDGVFTIQVPNSSAVFEKQPEPEAMLVSIFNTKAWVLSKLAVVGIEGSKLDDVVGKSGSSVDPAAYTTPLEAGTTVKLDV